MAATMRKGFTASYFPFCLRNIRISVRSCTIMSPSRDKLQRALAEYEKYDLQLRPYRVLSAVFGTSFSNAGLEVVPVNYDKNGNICHPAYIGPNEVTLYDTVKFSKLYEKGIQVLEEYVKSGVVEDRYQRALLNLLLYLSEIEKHEKSLNVKMKHDRRYRYESVQSAIIANHLLSKLVPNEAYILSTSSPYKEIIQTCPCQVKSCEDEIKFGSTSIGYEEMWYGSPDVVLYANGLGETSVLTPDWQVINNEEKTQIFEMKSDSYGNNILRYAKTINQCIAQALTFSFYQANFLERKPAMNCVQPVTLIPTISITLNSFDVYMYDYEHDVLLRNVGTKPAPLHELLEPKLNISSVIQIWLAINHSLFEAQLTDGHVKALKGSCNFHQVCGEKLSKFKKQSESSCFNEVVTCSMETKWQLQIGCSDFSRKNRNQSMK